MVMLAIQVRIGGPEGGHAIPIRIGGPEGSHANYTVQVRQLVRLVF